MPESSAGAGGGGTVDLRQGKQGAQETFARCEEGDTEREPPAKGVAMGLMEASPAADTMADAKGPPDGPAVAEGMPLSSVRGAGRPPVLPVPPGAAAAIAGGASSQHSTCHGLPS